MSSNLTTKDIITRLKALENPLNVEGMARFGITPKKAFGVKQPELRAMAKEIEKDHELALELWEAGIRETMMLAVFIDNPEEVTREQMESWVLDFDNWEACDHTITHLFQKTPFAFKKALEWAEREEEFVKRAGFVLMARIAVADKTAKDEDFEPFYPLILKGATDERNNVKKAVNWAIRQIGKRNPRLHRKMLALAYEIRNMDSKAARWVASDAIRELESDKVRERLLKKEEKRTKGSEVHGRKK